MAWQTYDIDFRAARYQGGKKIENAEVSVRHNGFLIHDRVEIPRPTDLGRPEGDTTGPIQLQRHGSEVIFGIYGLLRMTAAVSGESDFYLYIAVDLIGKAAKGREILRGLRFCAGRSN